MVLKSQTQARRLIMKNVHKKFLEFIGFSDVEAESMLEDWKKAADLLELDEKDIVFAIKEWIPKHWNMKLKGIRQMLCANIREVVDIFKIEDYKKDGYGIIYGVLPSVPTNYYAMKYGGGKIYVGYPHYQLISVMGALFHKENKYIDRAEALGMTQGCKHCALNKTRIGTESEGLFAQPDVVWSWGYTCDEAPKTDEFIKCSLNKNWNYIVTRLPHDTNLGERDNEKRDRVEYVAESIKDGQRQIEKTLDFTVSDEDMWKAVSDVSRYFKKIHRLNELNCKLPRQLVSGSEMSLIAQPIHIPFNTGLEHHETALDTLISEIEKKGEEADGPKRPKIGCYFASYSLPWISRLFLENDIDLSFSTIMSFTDRQFEASAYDDPFMVIAEQWLGMPLAVNASYEMEMVCEKIEKYKPDAMLFGFFNFDRWMGGHQKMMVSRVEEKTSVPHFYIEGNFWDDRNYGIDDLATRIESISNYVKMNKMLDGVGDDE